jgi:hypothetical protein
MYTISCDECKISAQGDTLGAAIDNFNKHHINHLVLTNTNTDTIKITPQYIPSYPSSPYMFPTTYQYTQCTQDKAEFVSGFSVVS